MIRASNSRPLVQSGAIDRDAPEGSAAKCAFWIACSIDAYAEPVPAGKLGVAERDAIAVELGQRWAAKVASGDGSCAWHEIAEWRGIKCPCAVCSPKGGAA